MSCRANRTISWRQTFRMTSPGQARVRRVVGIVVAGGALVAVLSTATAALLAHLTRIPLGRGTATITWTGSTGVTPTIKSIRGTAGGYTVSGSGHIPKPAPMSATASTVPAHYPLADVKGTLGGTNFILNIVLKLPGSLASNAQQTFGHVTGAFRNQPVT